MITTMSTPEFVSPDHCHKTCGKNPFWVIDMSDKPIKGYRWGDDFWEHMYHEAVKQFGDHIHLLSTVAVHSDGYYSMLYDGEIEDWRHSRKLGFGTFRSIQVVIDDRIARNAIWFIGEGVTADRYHGEWHNPLANGEVNPVLTSEMVSVIRSWEGVIGNPYRDEISETIWDKIQDGHLSHYPECKAFIYGRVMVDFTRKTKEEENNQLNEPLPKISTGAVKSY